MSSQFQHVPSHASLLRGVSAISPPPSSSRLDAIVVPASRPNLQRVIALSAVLSVPLVALCSRLAKAEKVAERVEATFGARALIVDVPHGYQLLGHRHLTADASFRRANAERSSDLSVKRNIGLVLAHLRHWNKILFIDDDIYLSQRDVARFSTSLDRHPVAAMASKYFPDNSVVCHARRMAGFAQDVFVGGAVLGVNTQHPAVSFFPDIYNEDWFFFARHAAARSLPKIGEARQDEYDPFADPRRAAHEEFGDLLGEGLYALFNGMPGWELKDHLKVAASSRYWQLFIEDRRSMISETFHRISAARHRTISQGSSAKRSLLRAAEQLELITPDLCVDFIQKWQIDDNRWQQIVPRRGTVLSERDAMDELDLTNWISCGYGTALRSSGSRTPSARPSLMRCSDP
ncbi:hypothetical protein EV643_104239 [Kribbella sp. VKM Ac-2527]|uniref:Glycosyl transferase family 2 n=1 Tax=Kribbella caucasensis TaxID=2512215 RepID=A0A4R6KJT4_9ACTN|nr:hypothetical protein [Kribbella sp. VKM Ac-2527]TDO50742.1 hypothetical protein EV643_104239 [Kribbella sp. VKM Ac-2527]